MAKVLIRLTARRDLVQHISFLIENAGDPVALHFKSAAEQTFADLVRMPGMGSPQPRARFPRMCRWRVRGFEKYLIFYQPISDGIEILRIIHSSRDVERIFGSGRE